MADNQETGNYEFEFFKTLFRINKGFYNNLPEQLSHRFEPVEIMAIHYLRNKGEMKTSVLSGYLGIPGSTLTGILDRMEKKDLIVRTRDLVDRRIVLVKLSDGLLENGPKIEDLIRDFLKMRNINLPSSWWIDVTRELKKLEDQLIDPETRNKNKNWRLPTFVVLLGSFTAFLDSSIVNLAFSL